MIRDIEILDELKQAKAKVELLANPLYNDFCGSHFWGNINEQLDQMIKDIDKNLQFYNIIK